MAADIETVVIGAGVVGLAIAKALADAAAAKSWCSNSMTSLVLRHRRAIAR